MRDKQLIVEEPCEGKLSCTVLKTSGIGDNLVEFNNCLPEFKKVWVEYAELVSQALQATLKRVDFAYKRFFKPNFLKEGHQKVKAASKRLRRKRPPNRSKKVKGSRRWKRKRKRVSKLQRQITRQREDWLHKTTSDIVSSNSLVAGEQLNVKGMTRKAKKGKRKQQKAGLNRSILDVGFGIIGDLLTYKVRESGGFYVESPTQELKPTQRCAKCWELTPKTLADRVHICSNPDCNHVEDRDVNAAQVNEIWARGLERVSLDAESPSSTSYSKYEAAIDVEASETVTSTK